MSAMSEQKAALDAAKARLAAIGRQIAELKISAPIGGIVNAVELVPGDLIVADAPVMTILDLNRIWLRAYVPEDRLDIAIGRPVSVIFDAWPDVRLNGRVAFVSSQSEFTASNVQTSERRAEQVFRIKVTLDEAAGRDLRPGMAADIVFDR